LLYNTLKQNEQVAPQQRQTTNNNAKNKPRTANCLK